MREKLREWSESIETYVLDVITLRRTDKKAVFVRGVLYCFSLFFEAIVRIRKFLYDVRILRDTTLGQPSLGFLYTFIYYQSSVILYYFAPS